MSRAVSVQGGSLYKGRSLSRGLYLGVSVQGVSVHGRSLSRGVSVQAETETPSPCGQNDSQTPVKVLPCP